MKKTALTVALFALASPVFAQAMVEDTDASGGYSMEELMVVYTDLTEETFTAIDTDASGEVSAEELAAAIEAGILPAMQ